MASTEPDAGSDVAAIATTAVREGDDYVSQGTRCSSQRSIGNFSLVSGVTNPEEPQET